MANRRNHGRYPREKRAGKASQRRKGSCHGRRGHAQVSAKHQALLDFCPGPVAPYGFETIDGLKKVHRRREKGAGLGTNRPSLQREKNTIITAHTAQ